MTKAKRVNSRGGGMPEKPQFDGDILWYGELVVKNYSQPATAQRIVLEAFEEDGWPREIDDPLPPQPGINPKKRLHDTINNLNRNQRVPLLKFSCCRCGQGIRWESNGSHELNKKCRRKFS